MSLADYLTSFLQTAGTVLDTPRAMAWQLPLWAAGGASPLDVALNPEKRATGGDLAAALGMPGNKALAIGSEIALDPLNIVGILRLLRLGQVAKEAKGVNALREARLATGGMPEEIAEKTLLRATPRTTVDHEELRKIFESEYNYPALEWMSPKEIIEDAKRFVGTNPEYHSASERLMVDRLRRELEIPPPGKPAPLRLYHGTAEVYGRPSEALTQARSFHRSGQYSEHPPLHFMTPDPSYAEGFSRGAASSIDRGEALEIARDDLVSAFVRGGEKNRSEFDKAWELLSNDKYLGVPQEHVRMAYADVRNPISFGDWRKLISKHGWTKYGPREANAAQRALEEAKLMGHDALATKPIKSTKYNEFPDEIATFSTSQIYSPWIAPRARKVPKLERLLAGMAGYNAYKLPNTTREARDE